ncbi:ABC transporter permease [Roseomonas frigidaquae]|uniref:ABC transporter permease n=1 Tax=Falsiroseomonas frigidaquae TaxID=487318 RepID=A0ABX1F1Z0_9PROT|nr:ABC transporter permease [Falsiroseomonas frigidaquae]NKE46338.1 ABC transporter permease [Falsiroseomonas frigidaquae]
MNLALADIRHKFGRFVLTCFGLGLLMAVALSMVGIYQGVVTEALALSRSLRADLWVVESGTRGPFAEASRIPGDVREMVARLPGVVEAGAITLRTAEAQAPQGTIRVQVIGYEPGRPGGPSVLASGRGLGGARFEIVADARSGLPLGATLMLGRYRYHVVGTTRGLVASGGDPLIFMQLRDSQDLQFRLAPAAARRAIAANAGSGGTDTVNAIIARLHPDADPALVAETARRWKHLAALTDQEQSNLLTLSVVNRARVQLGMFTVVLLFVSAVIIALIIYTMTMDKLREIATLKLIGAPDSTIVGLVLQQALLLGGVAYVAAVAIVFSARDVFPRAVALGPTEVAVMAAVIAVICMLGSLVSIRAALRIEPQQALGG